MSPPDGHAVPPDPAPLRAALLAWYDREGRDLPFRATTDPWAILVSEAMAQQTQAGRAGEAWTAFMARYPTPGSLADATPADVLRAWRGLGYNRRALALQGAARVIVGEHGGRVPSDLAALEALPGVGPYTARAVAAFAFSRPVGPVDTNVRRVLGRVVVGDEDALPAGAVQDLADALVDPARPGDWTHALMDVGATRCRPARPDCAACPLEPWCRHAALPAASGSRRTRAVNEAATPFERTDRWLRGRIVDRLRDADGDAWVAIRAPIGWHDGDSVAATLARLEREGLVERDPSDPRRARLPTAPGRSGPARSGTL